MREIEYSEAAVEVLDILNHTVRADVELIPKSFMKFLTDIASKNYQPQFNHKQPVSGLNLRKETKELLGFIYITWWCDEDEREEYKKQIHEENIKNEIMKGNYNENDIFKNKKENQENTIIQNEGTQETGIIEYKKENILKKITNKILSFFGSKKERG